MDNLNNYLKFSKFIKKFILPIGSIKLVKKIIFNKNKNFAILCYHRIVDESYFFKSFSPLDGLCDSKKKFYNQINYIKNNFKIVSLDELNETILKKKDFVISITFDDGYKDNLTNAYPILNKLKIPFTIFVVPRFLEGDTFMWWYELWDFINCSNFILIKNEKYFCNNIKLKVNLFHNLMNILINMKLECQKKFLKKLRKSSTNIDYAHLCLDWNDIDFLSKQKLITIANHTFSHLRLKNLSQKELFFEVVTSKKILENKLNRKINYIAYPFGGDNDISNENLLFSKENNYVLGFSTKKIINYKNLNLMELPRYNVDNDISPLSLMGKINGFEDLILKIKNCFK